MSPPLVAGLDSSGESYSVALARAGRILSEAGGAGPRVQLRGLIPGLQACAERAGGRLSDLQALAVTTGPGSFTGLRLGVITARTVAQVLGLPILPVCTLQALAMSAPGHRLVVAALDARRGEIFARRFDTRGPWPTPLDEVQAWDPRALAEAAAGWGPGALLGSAAHRYRAILSAVEGLELLISPLTEAPRGAAVALLGERALSQGLEVAPLHLHPTYLRPAEVQVHGARA